MLGNRNFNISKYTTDLRTITIVHYSSVKSGGFNKL